tara:strand:- start:605 stop:733 length:129 start_codon:yes stop_codon:yes gene_type:complete
MLLETVVAKAWNKEQVAFSKRVADFPPEELQSTSHMLTQDLL